VKRGETLPDAAGVGNEEETHTGRSTAGATPRELVTAAATPPRLRQPPRPYLAMDRGGQSATPSGSSAAIDLPQLLKLSVCVVRRFHSIALERYQPFPICPAVRVAQTGRRDESAIGVGEAAALARHDGQALDNVPCLFLCSQHVVQSR
jgi:hypothetical protein